MAQAAIAVNLIEVSIAELVEDFKLYPRSQVDGAHVARMVQALEAEESLPPIIIDAKSKRIIDGFHRKRAFLRAFGEEAKIEVEAREYSSEKDMYLDALRLNSRHGKGITGSEQTGAILKAQELRIPMKLIAESMGVTVERVKVIVEHKVGTVRNVRLGEVRVPLKRSVSHLNKLTKRQADAMDMLPGQSQLLMLRQINKMIEVAAMALDDERVKIELRRLRDQLGEMDLD